jgi:hypothetical protein
MEAKKRKHKVKVSSFLVGFMPCYGENWSSKLFCLVPGKAI